MKTDIELADLSTLLNNETYTIDIHKQPNNSAYINAKTLFKNSAIIAKSTLKTYLERGLENGNSDIIHNSTKILGNMPNVNIPLTINGVPVKIVFENGKVENYIRSSEHLYQAFRFITNENAYQNDTLAQVSSMGAKKKAKRIICRPYPRSCFNDFSKTNPKDNMDATLEVIRIMFQAVRIKLAYKQKLSAAQEEQNFGKLLLKTGTKNIIEVAPMQTRNVDTFWGTKMKNIGTLTGMNIMGKLLMILRENYLEDVKNKTDYTRNFTIPNDLNLNILGDNIIDIKI